MVFSFHCAFLKPQFVTRASVLLDGVFARALVGGFFGCSALMLRLNASIRLTTFSADGFTGPACSGIFGYFLRMMVDLLFSPTGVRLCEVNSAPGFAHTDHACGIDLADEIAQYVETLCRAIKFPPSN
jgi:hypothetical protein